MQARATAVFCVITLLMTAMIFRIYYIDMADYTSMVATTQGTHGLEVATMRGSIYDRHFSPLVNGQYVYVASVLPTPQAATALLDQAAESEKAALAQRLSQARPFVTSVMTGDIYADGIDVFRIPKRYGRVQLAPHLVGYLSGDEKTGIAGIEKAYDSWLVETGGEIITLYRTDAAGRAIRSDSVGVNRKNQNAQGGVVLTLDASIQEVVEQALVDGCEKGAAVVMDIHTGDIVAMASIPAFDQNDIAASLDSTDAPFINRGISGYNIGSVFKLVMAAAALEQGISVNYTHDCAGQLNVSGQVFRCNFLAAHGTTNMRRALEVSCNTYFINLLGQLNREGVLNLCRNLGLGSNVELAPGMFTQPGNLPTVAELHSPAALANFSFGQGSSMATPLQMAQVVSTIAGGGVSVHPRLVAGLTEDGQSFSEQNPIYAANQILNESTAATLKNMMVDVIETGSGRLARPVTGGAGGKTSSAQTGQFITDDEGGQKEIVHAWFAGFYPAGLPRYSIVVFVEGGESGEQVVAPIFKVIADGIEAGR